MVLTRVNPATIRALHKFNSTRISILEKQQCMLFSTTSSRKKSHTLIPKREEFASRHIGPRAADRDNMLAYIGFKVCYSQMQYY